VSIKNKFILTLLGIIIIGGVIATGCMGGSGLTCASAPSRGWAGGTVSDGKLFVASMGGKVIAIDATTGNILDTPIQLSIPTSGGILGCSSSASPLWIYASPVVLNQMVYVGGNDGKIHGYPFDNNTLSSNPSSHSDYLGGAIIGGIVIVNDRIYFATSVGTIYALNANSLGKEWDYNIGSKIWSAPAVAGNTLYIGSLDKKLYALNTSDGTKIWEYETEGAISATPVVYDNKVYIGDYDRCFYALDAINGNLIWKYPAANEANDKPQNWFWAKPVILNDTIYAPCLDGNVYALNASTGNLINKYVLGDSISSSPAVIGNSIVVATTDLRKKTGKVFLIDTTDKSQKELDSFAEGINAPLFVNDDVVYVHTLKDNLYGINILTKARQTFSLSTVK
jgi:outer membrane protein assembly factor BamB